MTGVGSTYLKMFGLDEMGNELNGMCLFYSATLIYGVNRNNRPQQNTTTMVFFWFAHTWLGDFLWVWLMVGLVLKSSQ